MSIAAARRHGILPTWPDRAAPVPQPAQGFVLGRERFARISAVEGVALTPEMRATLERFDREGLSAEERRRATWSATRRRARGACTSRPDPYCYPGTAVLKIFRALVIRQPDGFETLITAQRAEEPLPRGRLGYAHYLAIHRHLFQDVFAWAGRLRSVRIAKGGSMFCYPEHIDGEMSNCSPAWRVLASCEDCRRRNLRLRRRTYWPD